MKRLSFISDCSFSATNTSQYQLNMFSNFSGVYQFSFLANLGSCQLQSSTMSLVSDLSGLFCAVDDATTVIKARSLIDCQRRCTTQQNKCYASNFIADSSFCELFNFMPSTFTNSRHSCKLFRVISS